MFGTRIPQTQVKQADHDVFERYSLHDQVKDYLINPSTAGLSSYLSDLPGDIDFEGHSLSASLSKTKPDVNFEDIIKLFTIEESQPNEIPVPDPVKQQVKLPMGLVDSSQSQNEKRIILRLGLKKDSKRKSLDEADVQPLKKFKDC